MSTFFLTKRSNMSSVFCHYFMWIEWKWENEADDSISKWLKTHSMWYILSDASNHTAQKKLHAILLCPELFGYKLEFYPWEMKVLTHFINRIELHSHISIVHASHSELDSAFRKCSIIIVKLACISAWLLNKSFLLNNYCTLLCIAIIDV